MKAEIVVQRILIQFQIDLERLSRLCQKHLDALSFDFTIGRTQNKKNQRKTMKQCDEYADYFFVCCRILFIGKQTDREKRDKRARKHSHIDIKQNTKSLRSNNDCNIGRVCWMECEMSRSRILLRDVFISINVHFCFISQK